MVIEGIGVDIIEVDRIKRLVQKNPRFLNRIFTTREIDYCQNKKNKFQHLAARFAAKEAFFKAIGKKIRWTDVEVTHLQSGKPQLHIKDPADFSFQKTFISLSHLDEYAVATVILEK